MSSQGNICRQEANNLLSNDMVIDVHRNPKESTGKLLELMSIFGKVARYKINIKISYISVY
jgi:hypothetical protein